jgi:polyphenol oxidase
MTAYILTSRLLSEIPHAFSTRVGGISEGFFRSLNLGNPSDLPLDQRDPPSNIRENFRRILAAMGCEGRMPTEVHQVHGCAVHDASAPGTPDPKADAVFSDDPGRVLAIRVADCTPVLLATADGRHVAAVHAGWRGVISGVLPATVAALRTRSSTPLLAAIGPCIGPEHFEVGPEVVAEFDRVFPERGVVARRMENGKGYVDLKGALAIQLGVCGVADVEVLPHCTYADPELFYSHRRDRGLTGRAAGLIAPRV